MNISNPKMVRGQSLSPYLSLSTWPMWMRQPQTSSTVPITKRPTAKAIDFHGTFRFGRKNWESQKF